MKNIIHVYKPSIKRKDLEYVLNCMIQDKIDYGEFARNFENRLTERVGCYDTIATNSFYSSIELVLDALEIQPGDEVILPSFCHQTYLNVILNKKAVPKLVDMEENGFQPSLQKIRELVTPKTKILFLVYYFGYAYDPTPYLDLVPYVVEDISSVLGAKSGEVKIGTAGRYAVADFSTKSIITTGEGGAVFCNSRKNYYRIKSLIETGEYTLEYSPRMACLMPDLTAAMGLSQDETLNHRLKLRTAIGKIYEEAIKRSRNSIFLQAEGNDRIYSDFPILVKSSLKDAIHYLKKNDIEAIRPFPFLLHHYLNMDKLEFPHSEHLYLNTLLIPIHSTLLKKEVDLISKALATML